LDAFREDHLSFAGVELNCELYTLPGRVPHLLLEQSSSQQLQRAVAERVASFALGAA